MKTDREIAWAALMGMTETYIAICALPEEIGAKVRWPHNDIVWTRVSSDGWSPIDGSKHYQVPSSHVASQKFEVVAK